jgi:hypothetical protein
LPAPGSVLLNSLDIKTIPKGKQTKTIIPYFLVGDKQEIDGVSKESYTIL